MNSRRSFLRLAKAVVIAASVPIIIREALRLDKHWIDDVWFQHEIDFSALQVRGPSLYDWIMADDKQRYLDECRQRRLNHQA